MTGSLDQGGVAFGVKYDAEGMKKIAADAKAVREALAALEKQAKATGAAVKAATSGGAPTSGSGGGSGGGGGGGGGAPPPNPSHAGPKPGSMAWFFQQQHTPARPGASRHERYAMNSGGGSGMGQMSAFAGQIGSGMSMMGAGPLAAPFGKVGGALMGASYMTTGVQGLVQAVGPLALKLSLGAAAVVGIGMAMHASYEKAKELVRGIQAVSEAAGVTMPEASRLMGTFSGIVGGGGASAAISGIAGLQVAQRSDPTQMGIGLSAEQAARGQGAGQYRNIALQGLARFGISPFEQGSTSNAPREKKSDDLLLQIARDLSHRQGMGRAEMLSTVKQALGDEGGEAANTLARRYERRRGEGADDATIGNEIRAKSGSGFMAGPKDQENLDRLNESMALLGQQWDKLVGTLGRSLIPAVTKFFEALGGGLELINHGLDAVDRATKAFGGLGFVFTALVSPGTALGKLLGDIAFGGQRAEAPTKAMAANLVTMEKSWKGVDFSARSQEIKGWGEVTAASFGKAGGAKDAFLTNVEAMDVLLAAPREVQVEWGALAPFPAPVISPVPIPTALQQPGPITVGEQPTVNIPTTLAQPAPLGNVPLSTTVIPTTWGDPGPFEVQAKTAIIPTSYATPTDLEVIPQLVSIPTGFIEPPQLMVPPPPAVGIPTSFLAPGDLSVDPVPVQHIATQFDAPPKLVVPPPSTVVIPVEFGRPGAGGQGVQLDAQTAAAALAAGATVTASGSVAAPSEPVIISAPARAATPGIGAYVNGTAEGDQTTQNVAMAAIVAAGLATGGAAVAALTGSMVASALAAGAVTVQQVLAGAASLGGSVTGVLGNLGGCFAAGTLVSTPLGRFPIETILVGQVVYAVDTAGDGVLETAVTAVLHHTEPTGYLVLRVTTRSGQVLRVTPDHLVFDPLLTVYVPAARLAPGSALLLVDVARNEPVLTYVEAVAVEDAPVAVYNLHVAHAVHNYLANGLLVHNAKSSLAFGYAEGGIVMPTPGGQLGVMAEAGVPEAAIPLNSRGADFMRQLLGLDDEATGTGLGRGSGGQGGVTIHNHFDVTGADFGSREFAERLSRLVSDTIGGNLQMLGYGRVA